MSNPHNDEKFYEQVAKELLDGNMRQGLWLKAGSKAMGNPEVAKSLYIEWRVEQLVEEAKQAEKERLIKLEAARKEEQKRKAVEAIKDSKAAVEALNGLKKHGYTWVSDYSFLGDFQGWLLFKNENEIVRFKSPSEVKKWVKKNLPQ